MSTGGGVDGVPVIADWSVARSDDTLWSSYWAGRGGGGSVIVGRAGAVYKGVEAEVGGSKVIVISAFAKK